MTEKWRPPLGLVVLARTDRQRFGDQAIDDSLFEPRGDVGSLLLVANDNEWQCGTGEVVATLDLSATTHPIFEFIRLTGSRRSQSQLLAYPWQGDVERILPFLSHMELPLNDIIE